MNTKSKIATIAVALGMAASSSILHADEDADLVVNGEIEMVVRTAAPAHLEGAVSTIYSGWVFRADETQAMQADDFDNPGMLFVENGEQLFNTAMGADGQSCASCHQSSDLTNVRATYPKWDAEHGAVQTVEMQVRECQTEQMGMEEPWGINSGDMLDITAFIASVGRGQIVDVAIDGPAHETWELGREIYYTRFGQLELSCANCHEENYGNRIRADHLSQGQINGFPTYRLKNARLNGVQNRFRGCVRDTRAETYAIGSDEFVALELYVASRGNGLTVEGPSVRN